MSAQWVIQLLPSDGDATRKVGGLALSLRNALDAQAAGFAAVVDNSGDHKVLQTLADKRLRIPVVPVCPKGARVVTVPIHWVLHRSTIATIIAQTNLDSPRIDITACHFKCSAPFGFEPIAVINDQTARQAEKLLFRALRKAQDGWTSRWLNRYISLAISRWLVRTPFSPNQISVAILAVGLFGAYLATRGTYYSLALGAGLFQLQSILDGCDGEVSRITYRGSKAGEWFDTIGDDLTNYSFFAGAAWGLYQSMHQPIYLIAGVITLVCGLLSSGLEYRYLIRIGSGDLLRYPLSQATMAPAKGIGRLAPLLKRDSFVLLTLLAALAGIVGLALLIFAVGAIGIAAAVLKTEWRLSREAARAR
jgi:phosphatidylglycerophosphate synthase